MWELIIGGAIAASGWVAAFVARGQSVSAKQAANDAAERARLAETKTAAADAHAQDAEARAGAAAVHRKVLETELGEAHHLLESAFADREQLLEELAKMGAPVGADLLDNSIARLYADRDRQAAARARGGEGPLPGGGEVAVPPGIAEPAASTDPGAGKDV